MHNFPFLVLLFVVYNYIGSRSLSLSKAKADYTNPLWLRQAQSPLRLVFNKHLHSYHRFEVVLGTTQHLEK